MTTNIIPNRLRCPEYRFDLLKKKSKIPFEKDWQTKNNYSYDNSRLLDWIKKGNNYGILGYYGDLLFVDSDHKIAERLVEKNLPPTFCVKTGSGKKHYYYICQDGKNLKLFLNEKKDTLADIQFQGRQVVAPSSIHPNGNKYEVLEDLPIAEIDFSQLIYCFKDYLKYSHKERIKKTKESTYEETDPLCKKIKEKIKLQNLMKNYNYDLTKNPTMCGLGHTSQNESCFSYDNDLWHCFHCEEGGNIFHFVMAHDKCNFITARNKLAEMCGVEIKPEYKKIKLADLNATLINKFIEVDCQITGEQSQKAIPEEMKLICNSCDSEIPINLKGREKELIFNILKLPSKCPCGNTDLRQINTKYQNLAIVYIRDLLDRESLFAIKRYEPKRAYVINQTLPKAKTVNIKGKVFIEPKTKNISIIADTIRHLENQIEDFKVTEKFKENSKKYFNSEDIYKQINPDIVGKPRDIAKQSIILQLHSPCKIYDITRKKLIRGGLNVVFYGDTKCAKSDLSKDVTQKGNMPLGEYTIVETGGRTGFLYTIDKDKNSLIWGSLALNDMGLVVLDGLQSMHSEELAEFREAIEQQEIIVRRSITGDALARTRILACLNPNKPMINYIYKCQAILDTYAFSKSQEITRHDLFIPFGLRDVSGGEIAHRKSEDRLIPEDVFMDHVYWVWSRKPEQIIYTESAIRKINDLSEEFIKNYSLEILPIVHNGIREILTRFSVAMACQMHSTDETHEKIIVETEHVEKSVKWYKEVLTMLELERYKQDIEGKSELTDNECVAISRDLGEIEFKILELIKHERVGSLQLAEKLDKVPKTIKEHYKLLHKHRLIETTTGVGIGLSVRGIKFVRWGMVSSGNIVTNNVTNKNDSNKKCYYVTGPDKIGSSKYNKIKHFLETNQHVKNKELLAQKCSETLEVSISDVKKIQEQIKEA